MTTIVPEEKYARRWDVAGYDSIDTSVLETLTFDYSGSETQVEYTDPEFTSVCPWTGLPDFGVLHIELVPGDRLVELKSLKYYLNSFRNVGILQEHVVNRIKDDLARLLNPRRLKVTAEFNPRGGLSTRASAEFRLE